MSKPLNPLDKYRGFSTHHVMIVAHTSETIRTLTTRISEDQDSSFLDKISEAKIGEPIKSKEGTDLDAYLLIDSRKLSNFIIRDIDYQTIFSGGTLSQTQLVTANINMTIFDAYGVTFINYIKHLCDNVFFCDYNGLIFLLKTIYIGHTDEGNTETIATAEIPMLLVNMQMSVDHTGAIYTVNFAPLNGSIPLAMSEIHNISVTTIKGGTLGEIIDCLQNELNRKVREYYTKLNKIEDGASKPSSSIGRPVQYMFTLPGDIITGDKEWRNFKMTGVLNALKEQSQSINKIKEQQKKQQEENDKKFEQQQKDLAKELRKPALKLTENEIQKRLADSRKGRDEAKKEKEKSADQNKSSLPIEILESSNENMVFLSLNTTASIHDVLTKIFSMCPDINQGLSLDAIKEKKIEVYKTKTYLTSDTETLTAHYDIIAQSIVEVNDPSNTTSSKFPKLFKDKNTPINSIEFDYIFSGKNTDILTLDIKLENAVLYLNNIDKLSEDARRNIDVAIGTQDSKNKQKITIDKKDISFTLLKNTPILPTTKTQLEQNAHTATQQGNAERLGKSSTELAKLRQEGINSLAFLHGVSSQDVKMTIRGNPDLMIKSFCYGEILPHVKVNNITALDINTTSTFNSNDQQVYKDSMKRQLEGTKIAQSMQGPDFSSFPLFCKVNIHTPNVDIYGVQIDNNFAKQYWFDGWYYVREINHLFKNGEFTQEFHMHAYDLFKYYKDNNNEDDKNVK